MDAREVEISRIVVNGRHRMTLAEFVNRWLELCLCASLCGETVSQWL